MAVRVLVVCTANVCRSPMAGAMLAAMCADRGVSVHVTTAGTDAPHLPVDPRAVALMAERGLDLSGHRPRQVQADDVAAADLVLCMTRQHLRHLAASHQGSFRRTFTVRELARRLMARGPGAAFDVAALHDGRTAAQLLGDSPDDDVDDPYGGQASAYLRCVAELDASLSVIAAALAR